jgi:hypothetical protein
MNNQNLKTIVLIFFSLIFWLEASLVIYLGIRLLFFNRPAEINQKTITPAEIRNKI